MPKTILIHSFRHGVGRSNIAANLAFLMAQAGQHVGIVDTDTKVPGSHLLFGLSDQDLKYSFNDYLLGTCNIEDAAYNLNPHLQANLPGQLFLIPGNAGNEQNAYELSNAPDVHLLNTGCSTLIDTFNLDTLVIDTKPGVSQTALVAITVSDTLVIVLRMDQRDYQGTSVTMEVVRQLEIPRTVLIVNEAPTNFNYDEIKTKMEQIYQCKVAAILPHVDEVTALANKDIFALRYPEHPLTMTLTNIATDLVD